MYFEKCVDSSDTLSHFWLGITYSAVEIPLSYAVAYSGCWSIAKCATSVATVAPAGKNGDGIFRCCFAMQAWTVIVSF